MNFTLSTISKLLNGNNFASQKFTYKAIQKNEVRIKDWFQNEYLKMK